MAAQNKSIKEASRRRSSPDGSISSSTKSTNISKMKKSASFVTSNSRYPLQEEMKLTSGDHLCGGSGKKDDSINLEESISSAIKFVLQKYTKSPQASLKEINEKVSQIYDIVGRAVVDVLQNVTVQQSPSASAAKHTELKVAEHPAMVTVKPIDEENLYMSQCSLSPPVSPTPGTIGIEKQGSVEANKSKSAPQSTSSQRSIISPCPSTSSNKRPDSVKTDDSAPWSASSQRSIVSPCPSTSSNKRPDSVKTDDSAPWSASSQCSIISPCPSTSSNKRPDSVKTDDSAPQSASSQRSIQSLGDKFYSSINTNESITKVKCYIITCMHLHARIASRHAYN